MGRKNGSSDHKLDLTFLAAEKGIPGRLLAGGAFGGAGYDGNQNRRKSRVRRRGQRRQFCR